MMRSWIWGNTQKKNKTSQKVSSQHPQLLDGRGHGCRRWDQEHAPVRESFGATHRDAAVSCAVLGNWHCFFSGQVSPPSVSTVYPQTLRRGNNKASWSSTDKQTQKTSVKHTLYLHTGRFAPPNPPLPNNRFTYPGQEAAAARGVGAEGSNPRCRSHWQGSLS